MDNSKPASSGNCSEDLERAKDLSRALKGSGHGAAGGSTSPYVAFPQRAEAPAAPSRVSATYVSRPSLPLMARREPLKAPAGGFGAQLWNRLLDASVAAASAEAAFLMDPNGLVVSARGPRVGEELEAVGARLMIAFDQADRIEGGQQTLSMTVETPRGSLFGLRLRQSEGGVLTLGLVVPGGLTADRQARVLALVAAAGTGAAADSSG